MAGVLSLRKAQLLFEKTDGHNADSFVLLLFYSTTHNRYLTANESRRSLGSFDALDGGAARRTRVFVGGHVDLVT